MRTIVEILAAILVLDVLLVGVVGVAGTVSQRRAKRRAALQRLNLGRRLSLVPAAGRRPLRSRITVGALVAAVAFVLVATGSLTHGFNLMHQSQGGDHAVGRRTIHHPPRGRARHARRTARATVSRPGGSVIPGSPGAAAGISRPGSSEPTKTHTARPSVITATPVSATEIRLRWSDVANETGYKVERSSGGTTDWTTIATTAAGVTTYSDDGLPPGATYFYRVLAATADGVSAPSDVASSTTILLPDQPGGLTTVVASSSEIDLSWADVANETGFRVERSADGATGWVAIATTGQAVTTYANAGLTASTTYYYRVFATDAGGDSTPSEVVSALTGADSSSPAP